MRTYTKTARVALLLALVWSTGACDDLTSLNENKNAPEDVGAEFLLPQAIRSGVETSFGATMMLSHTAIWPQHVVQIQYPDEETGLVRPGNMDAFWNTYYVGPLSDIQAVLDKADAAGQANREAIALIWRAWLFHQVTDLWGDIPYSEALAGRDNPRPVYDSQQDVYTGLIADLTTAAGMLTPGGDGFGAGDILYGNNFTQWARFANSLRMRLAMRMVNKAPGAAQAAFVAAYNAGGFQSNADNAALRWPGSPYENTLYRNYLGRDDHGISATMVDTLASLADPRLALFAEPATADGVYRGHRNGFDAPPLPLGSYSRIGNFWRADGAATPSMIMTYSEVLLLQAEAAQRGWIGASAATLYAQGIRAHMTQYAGMAANNPTEPDITDYLANPRVVYNPATGLNQIHLQQWIGLYMNGNEAFAHWRRTGVPVLVPGPDLTVSRIPVRFSYPGGEQSFNSANLNAALSRQGGGLDLVTPLWWMP
jgi:hypothetical protein